MPALLEVSDLRAGYGGIEILRGVSFEVPRGSVVALLGSNGVGKTTTLRTIAGLVPATAGSIDFAGRPIQNRPIDAIAGRGLVMVPEGRGVFPGLSVQENLQLIHRSLGGSVPWAEFVDEVAVTFPRLLERLPQSAGSMSGGEQQMLAVSRVLVGDPRLVMFDELSMGLAPLIVDQLFASVSTMRDRGVTIILVEQFMTHALALADICYVMSKGRVSWAGEPSELRAGVGIDYLT